MITYKSDTVRLFGRSGLTGDPLRENIAASL